MTSQLFHPVMLLVLGAMSAVSWYGYKSEPCERRTALKCNAAAAVWFLYLFWAGPPPLIEASFVRSGLFVLSLALAINARRLMLGVEFLYTKHQASAAISSALRKGSPIDAAVAVRMRDRSAYLVPGLRIFLHRRQAEEALALRDKLNADALLAEAIVRRERARQEAELVRARRRGAPDAWREALAPRAGRQR